MKLKIAVLPGDGIGPEVTNVALDVVKAVCRRFGHTLDYATAIAGAGAIDAVGSPYPKRPISFVWTRKRCCLEQ